MGKKSAERRKHAETAKANGRALADEEGAVYRQNNRLWWAFSRRLDLWYGIILGATGFVCACDDQQGRGGICKHVVAVNVHLDRMWHAAKNAKLGCRVIQNYDRSNLYRSAHSVYLNE